MHLVLHVEKKEFSHVNKLSSDDIAAPGEQTVVRCLVQGSHLSRGHFLPEPGFEPTTLSYLGFQVQRSIH